MSLELYPSSENGMLSNQTNALIDHIDACKKAEVAIQCFVDDTSLTGETYSSAKNLASRSAIPAIRGIATLCSMIINANSQVILSLGQYSWTGSAQMSESQLRQEIEALYNRIDALSQMESHLLYESYAYVLSGIASQIEDRIGQMHSYNGATADAYSGQDMSDLMNAIQGALTATSAIAFNKDTMSFSANIVDWSFESQLAGLSSLISEEERYAIAFYHSLPPNLKAAVSINDMEATDDGFILCSKPLDAILTDMGITGFDPTEYQSLYLWGLSNGAGGFEYSMIRMLLPGQSTEGSVISVPFRSFDISVFDGLDSEDVGEIHDALFRVFDYQSTDTPSFFLLDYFTNPQSKASYLIADLAVNRTLNIAGIIDEGEWSPGTIAIICEEDVYTTAALKRYQEQGIVDITNGLVHIEDASHLSSDEKSAILACISSNPDFYSYAAENQFHAVMYNHYSFVEPMRRSAIVSDAGVGESQTIDYEYLFKERDALVPREMIGPFSPPFTIALSGDTYYTQQFEAHTPGYRSGK